jgi:hypothetical protein
MIHRVEQHQDDEELPRTIMNLPEECPIRNKGRDLFHILKHVAHGPVIKAQDKA